MSWRTKGTGPDRRRFRVTRHRGRLTAEQRRELPSADFALPAERKYPIDTAPRARDALSRVSANGTEREKREVCRAVAKRWPEIHAESCSEHGA